MNTYYVAGIPFSSNGSLSHHGIKGQRWGIRRYQNPDGSLTEEGLRRYGAKNQREGQKLLEYQEKEYNRAEKKYSAINKARENKITKLYNRMDSATDQRRVERLSNKIEKLKMLAAKEKRIGEQVLKDIQNMDVSAMNKEKMRKGSVIAASALVTFGSIPMAQFTGGYSVFLFMNPNTIVDAKREKVASKELEEASKKLMNR